ncbi:MAG: hypothetical protein AB7I50_14865 [Vicinamibacterales bacterium]
MSDLEPTSADRRRAPRVDLLANLQGLLVTMDEGVQVKQLGAGGMIVETSRPISARVTHDFRITLGSVTLTVHARVVHSRVLVENDVVTYVAGVEFLDVAPETVVAIEAILDEVGTVASEA